MAVGNISPEPDFKLQKKTRRNKKLKKITFETEIFTKDSAPKLLPKTISDNNVIEKNEQTVNISDSAINRNAIKNAVKKRRQKKKKSGNKANQNNLEEQPNTQLEIDDVDKSNEPPKKKKKKKQTTDEPSCSVSDTNSQSTEDAGLNKPVTKTAESIRAQKRRKYTELLKQKKIQTELLLQQKSLNYLSRWKHDRGGWKFEKLRQIWLLQNIYDSAKIPDKFWDTSVEYFCNAKGKIKDTITNDAVKIIEEFSEKSEEEVSEENKIKLQRAKSLMQNIH